MVKDRTQPLGAVLTVRPERLEWGGRGGEGLRSRSFVVNYSLNKSIKSSLHGFVKRHWEGRG